MRYTIICQSSGETESGTTQLAFCHALLRQGHEIERVFFYHDAVTNALATKTPPQDEANVTAGWHTFQSETGIELAVCIAAALRRGVLNDEEADRYDQTAATIDPAFTIVGLGQLIEAIATTDRTVTL